MRTLSSNESKIYDTGSFSVRLRVVVKDESGNDVELTNLEGRSWVEGIEVSDDIDQPVAEATVTLVGAEFDLNLSPGVTGSKINRPGGALQARLGINREIYIETALVPEHGGESSSEWRRIFHGDVDEIDLPSDGMNTQIRLRCRDKGGRLQRRWLERTGQRDLGDPTNLTVTMYETEGEDVEDVMGEILSDWGPAGVSLVTPVSPGWEIPQGTWEPEMTNVLEVLRSLASRIGWVVKYCWNGSAFELRFFEPPRTKSTPDFTLGPDKYFSISRFSDSLSGVRNRVEVFYRKGSEEDAETDSELRDDTISQTKYGVLYASIGENETTGITTATKAGELAQAILDDLKEPRAQLSATSIFLYQVELYDLIRFSPNGLLFDTNQDLSVVGYRHTLSADRIETELICRPGVAGSWKRWWDKIGDGEKGESVSAPPAPTLTATPTIRGVKLALDGVHLRHKMIEWHVSTTSSFTPDGSSLRARSVATSQVLSDLSQGTTYYAKAVVVSATNFPSPPSNEVTFQPSQAGTTDIANSAVTDGKLGAITGTNLVGGAGALSWLSSAGKLVKAFLVGAGSPATDLQLRSVDGEIRAENSGGTEGPYFRGASLKEGTGPLTKLSSAGLLDFTAAHPGKGALATKSSVDLATSEVTNKSLDNIADGSRKAVSAIDGNGKALVDLSQSHTGTLSGSKLAPGSGPLTNLSSGGLLDFSAAHSGKGALATKSSVDLSTSEVTSSLPKAKISSSGTWSNAEYPNALLQDGSRRADFVELKDSTGGGIVHRRLKNTDGKLATLDSGNSPVPLVISSAASFEGTAAFEAPATFEETITINQPTAFVPPVSDGMPYAAVYDRESTNWIANPSFEVSTTGWTATTGATLSRVTTQFFFGGAAGQVVFDATAGVKGIYSSTAVAAQHDAWGGQCYVKASTGTIRLRMAVEFLNTAETSILAASYSEVLTIGTAWTWLGALEDDAPASTGKVRVRLETDTDVSKTFFVDGVQLEKLPAATVGFSTYIDGSMGPGFSWSGTPHASSSTRVGGFHQLGPITNVASALPNFFPSFLIWDDGSLEVSQVWAREYSGLTGLPGIRAGVRNIAELHGDRIAEVSGGLQSIRLQATPVAGVSATENIDVEIRPNGAGNVILNGRTRLGLASNRLIVSGAGTAFPGSPTTGEVFFRTDFRSFFYYNSSAWVQISVGADSSAPASPQTNQRIWDTDTKSENYYDGSAWKSAPFSVLLDDEIHFWDLATDPGSIAAQGRANVAVSATGCTTTMVFWGWITSTLGLEISGAGVETGTDFAQHFCSSNGTLTHVFYNRDATNTSDRRSANSCTMGVDWS